MGRRREVEQIFMRLRNPEFESSSIVGERRSGKTSLLNYIAHPDAIRQYGLDPETYLFVYLDLEMITSTSTPTRLYQYMLRRIASKVQNETLKKEIRDVSQYENIDTYDLAELLDSMEDEGLHIVLLIDEFENVGDNANFGPDFYYGLRSLAIHHDLALITSTRVDLVEIAHSDAVRSSPFFNIFATINLQPFSQEDIQEILKSYLQDTSISFDEAGVGARSDPVRQSPFLCADGVALSVRVTSARSRRVPPPLICRGKAAGSRRRSPGELLAELG